MSDRVLVVASHPDDETLGCGGAILRHRERGDAVMVLVLADGVTSRNSIPSHSLQRRQQCLAALKTLGVAQHGFGDWPDNQLDTVPMLSLAKDIEEAIGIFQPSVVYTHHGGDLNVDHQRVAEATLIACRPQPGHPVKRVLHYEVPSSTEWQPGWRIWFEPNVFIDIDGALDTKLKAMACYVDEVRESPHPRSLEAITALATWRGSNVGLKAAEAFVLARDIC